MNFNISKLVWLGDFIFLFKLIKQAPGHNHKNRIFQPGQWYLTFSSDY